ncbi:MAG: TetR/AcrR family transcriptional regulator [Alphaproteobacteria bacterium]|nr:TetR/AcrR family transcriptional regulator [Alphaproteobacteria bacterium]MBO6628249.1 TetR/AcrR family transcriptional regulator [Alphaproteobacteria bacterium]MDF1627274.1 TetR/AcrR family transcriptional regulator [Parvibaculaceae bacterium]
MTNNHALKSSKNASSPSEVELDPSSPKPSKRRLESRRRLLAAARQLFVERGYHATRPQDISKAAGVGHGTFYLHFSDKLECFLAFAAEASGELDVLMQQHAENATGLESGIREVLHAIFEYSEDNPGVLAAVLTDLNVISTDGEPGQMPADQWAELWSDNIREWAAVGEVPADLDTILAGHVILGILRQGGAYAGRSEMPREEATDKLTHAIMGMLTYRK